MENDNFATFIELLSEFSHAMLVTRHNGNLLRSRPMAIANHTESGKLWFFTNTHSGKLTELAQSPNVNLAMQDGRRFMSISGCAELSDDRGKIRSAWNEDQRAWFQQGPDDPSLQLLQVTPIFAEYWDRSGFDGLKFRLAEARALLTGEQLGDNSGTHAKLDLNG